MVCAGSVLLLAVLSGYRVARALPEASELLSPATLTAFERYVAAVTTQNEESLRRGPFLWVDGLAEQERRAALAKLNQGEIEMRRLSVNARGRNLTVPGGMIHDWEGIVFVPGVKIDAVLELLEDYNHHATYFAPDVERAEIESHQGDRFRVFMRFRRKKIVTVVLDTEQEVSYFRDSRTRAHSRSSALWIRQVDQPGSREEKQRAPGNDDGFLWRMETWWRLEERNGGVYVQNQVVTLTRAIPIGLGWLLEPFLTKIPRETLAFTLEALRTAVLAREAEQGSKAVGLPPSGKERFPGEANCARMRLFP